MSLLFNNTGKPMTNTCSSVYWPSANQLPVKCWLTEGHTCKHERYDDSWTNKEAVPVIEDAPNKSQR